MSREVCGICWCPYDEDTGECACAPDPTAVLPRKPLSVDEIQALHKKAWPYCDMTTPDYEFARAIERAHGIGE